MNHRDETRPRQRAEDYQPINPSLIRAAADPTPVEAQDDRPAYGGRGRKPKVSLSDEEFLATAKRMLLDGQTIGQTAVAVGMWPANFSSRFTRLVGMPPRPWAKRERHRQPEVAA